MTDGYPPSPFRDHAVVTAAELRAAGISRRRLQALVESGALTRVHRGVYVTEQTARAAERDPRLAHAVRVAAALSASGRAGVGSHESAAIIHGIALLRNPRRTDVTLTRRPGARAGRRTAHGIIFHTAAVPAGHVSTYRGVPVTSVARTIADLARTGSFMSGVVSADNALYREKTTKADIGRVLAQCERWAGVEQARRVLEFADERAESPLESCARVVFAQRELPPPMLQADLGGDRYIGRVDFYWRQYYTVAEADGDLKYDGKAEALAQLERDQLLRAAGLRVIHFTWYQLFREQDKVIHWIRQAFAGKIS